MKAADPMREKEMYGANTALLFTLLCQDLQWALIHHPTAQRSRSEAVQPKNRGHIVCATSQPSLLGLRSTGCGSLAEGALQMAASVCAVSSTSSSPAGMKSAEYRVNSFTVMQDGISAWPLLAETSPMVCSQCTSPLGINKP